VEEDDFATLIRFTSVINALWVHTSRVKETKNLKKNQNERSLTAKPAKSKLF